MATPKVYEGAKDAISLTPMYTRIGPSAVVHTELGSCGTIDLNGTNISGHEVTVCMQSICDSAVTSTLSHK